MQFCRTKFVVMAILLFSSFLSAFAQTNTTALSGDIKDPDGLVSPESTVMLSNPDTGFVQNTESDKNGQFSFNQILPGKYTVTVNSPGFSEQVQNVVLLVNTPQKISFTLTIGTSQIVNVETTASALNTSDASLGKPFDSAQIQTLPYLANNVLSLLALQPGVLSFDPNNTTDTRSGTVNGARQDQSNVTLDGVDDNDQNEGYAFSGVLRSTRDSVEEFRVVTSGANADSGRSSGAQVSLVTRSGTNKIHGSAYYYYRSPALAANDWFNKQSQVGSGKSNISAKILQDTYGASFGAPIKKDKIFFFGAYEGFKQASNKVVTNLVPLGLRNGTITYVNTGGTTTTLSAAQIAAMDTKCFANGTCPAGAGVNAAAVAYFKQFPIANTSSVGDLYNTGGYTFTSPNPKSNITNIAKIDYNLTPKQILFVRGNLQMDNEISIVQFPGGPPNTNIHDNSRGIAGGHIWSISDRLTNNFRYGLTRQGRATRGATNQDYVTFAGLANLNSTNTSSVVLVTTHNFVDDFTWTKGKHTFQFGVNDRYIFNTRQADNTLYKTASVTYTSLAVGSIANQAGSSLDATTAGYAPIKSSFNSSYNNAIADVTGLITNAVEYFNFGVSGNSLVNLPTGTIPTRYYRSNESEFYAQDSFKVTPTLTVTGGLRYSYLGTPYESHGQEVAPTSSLHDFFINRYTNMQVGSSYNARISFGPAGSANGKPNLWTPDRFDLAPRVAFAYASPDGHTSVRGGFSLAYDHFGEGVINAYDQQGAFGLSTRARNGINQVVDTAPRFTGYHNVPTSIIPVVAGAGSFPVTPPDGSGNIFYSLDDKLHTPYAETFNLTIQREVRSGLTLTATYTGRLGRHLLMLNDLAEPLNLTDPGSGMTYFQATAALDKQVDSGVSVGNVQNIAFWQNQFPKASVTSNGVTYKGTQAVYLMTKSNRGNETATLATLDQGTTASPAGQSFRYFHPQFASLYAQSTIGTSNYHGFQLSLRQSLRHGFQYDINYTLAKSMDTGSAPERSNVTGDNTGSNSGNSVINSFDPFGRYGVSDFDVRHAITGNWVLKSPFGRGAVYFTDVNRTVDSVIGGWQLTGIVKWNSGLPFSSTDGLGWGTNWAVQSYNVQTGPVASGGHHYVSAGTGSYETAFANPAIATANIRAPYAGETGQRNNYRGDGYFSVDPGLNKTFNTFEGQSLKLTIEAFNVFNSVRFNAVTANGFSGTYGRYSTLLTPPRQMQIAARYSF
jgi:hypothetical protein